MTEKYSESSGVQLSLVRQGLGLSRQELAQRLDISSKSVFRYEKGVGPVPLSVARKVLDIILDTPSMQASVRWWNQYVEHILRTKTGIDVPEPVMLRGRTIDTQAAKTLQSVLELWGVFHPQMNPTEELIHSRISGLLNELTAELIPQQEIRCPTCGQSDRTHRFVVYEGIDKPVDMYMCDRCKEGGKIEKEKKD